MGVFRPARGRRFLLTGGGGDTGEAGPAFEERHFRRIDETPDEMFYGAARLVTHIDDDAIAALGAFYASQLQDGDDILDLMSSCVSHLPADLRPGRVVGHGMNAQELAANPQLDEYFVQNLNGDSRLPFADGEFDACLIAVSIQYLVRPLDVLAETGRILKPGGKLIVSFSNRMFPTKAVAVWRALDDTGHGELVSVYMRNGGNFSNVEISDLSPAPGRTDPLFAVTGRAG